MDSVRLPAEPDVTAPDGSDVRVLVRSERGSMAHFELAPGQTSQAVQHREVEELWFVVSGAGEMWLGGDAPVVVALEVGVSLRIPPGDAVPVPLAPGPVRSPRSR